MNKQVLRILEICPYWCFDGFQEYYYYFCCIGFEIVVVVEPLAWMKGVVCIE